MKIRNRILTILALALTAAVGLLFAACGGSKSTVTLSFDAAGGSPVASLEVAPGEQVALETPVREGYAFEGWYASSSYEGEGVRGTLTAPEKDTKYYAKWAEGRELTLDLGGGTASVEHVWVKPGTSILAALEGIVPARSGFPFGAWFYNGAQLTASARMPDSAATVTAKYLVSYTVEVYLENLSGTSFVRSDEDLTGGTWYLGESYSPEAPAIAHYELNEAPESGEPVTTRTLSEDASANVYRFYYDRAQYNIVYRSGGEEDEAEIGSGVYEQAVKLLDCPFVREGYRFAGWSTAPTGDVEYTAGQTIVLNGPFILFAVWDLGYTDRYGSADLIFFPRLEPGKAILLRGGMEFTGTRTGNDFTFTQNGHTMLEGRVYGAQYSYLRTDIADTYIFFENSADPAVTEQYDPTRTLTIDEYLNATYTEGGKATAGVAVYDTEWGDFRFVSDSKQFRFLPVHGDQFKYPAVFSEAGTEAGFYVDFTMLDFEEGTGFTTQSMLLALDGYGNVSLLDTVNAAQYEGRYYVEDTIVIRNTDYRIYRIVCRLYDSLGLLTGGAPGYVYNYVYTVPEVVEGYDGYVAADRYYGDYEGPDGTTLTLDGFGVFEDSAHYAGGSSEVTGAYTVQTSLLEGTLVSVYPEGAAEPVLFKLNLTAHTFEPYTEAAHDPYTAYRFMDGNSLQPPFLFLYAAKENVLRAEVYLPSEDESELLLVGRGTYAIEVIGGTSRFRLVTFTREWVLEGYEDEVAETLKFYTSSVTSTETYENYEVYCVLERNGEIYWEETDLGGGEHVLTTRTVTAGGLGSLYYTSSGEIYEAQFTKAQSEYGFSSTYGTLVYATPLGDVVTQYYVLTTDETGKVSGRSVPYTEQLVLIVPEAGAGTAGYGARAMYRDSEGRARYTDDDGSSFRAGTWQRAAETTALGDPIYTLTIGGEEVLRFCEIYQLELTGSTLLTSVYIAGTAGTYTAEDGSALLLDGFCRARYTGADGAVEECYYVRTGDQVSLSEGAEGERERIFILNGAAFAPIDWASSRMWQLLDTNYEPIGDGYLAKFDGEGGVKIFRADGETLVSSGTYTDLDAVYEPGGGYPEYLLRDVSLGSAYPEANYRVAFVYGEMSGQYAALVQSTATLGLFLDEAWNVLTLDGFGHGTLATMEFASLAGSYEVISAEYNVVAFTVEEVGPAEGVVYYMALAANGTFLMNDYAQYASVYFNSALESVVFGTDGTAYVGAAQGPYLVKGDEALVFLTETPLHLPVPGGETYSYGEKTYYRWDGRELVLSGKVEILGADGKAYNNMAPLDAVLTFMPNGNTNANVSATFTIGEMKYEGFRLSVYTSGSLMGTGSQFAPTVTYGHNVYPIAFTYAPGAQNAFTVTAGYNSVRLLDHNARYIPGDELDSNKQPIYRGGYIEKASVGFGPIVYEDVVYSGSFFYLYDGSDPTPITFEGIPASDVLCVGHVPSYGDRMEIIFLYNGTRYAIDYYEYYQGGNYYWAYGLYTVEDFDTAEYTVRVKSLAYTQFSTAPGYVADKAANPAIGQPIAVTLIRKAEEKAVVAYDTGYLVDGYGTGVWLVDMDGVEEEGTTGTCTWGKGYLVTFARSAEGAVTGVTVEEYEFVQVVVLRECLVNLFLDEEGKVRVVGFGVFTADHGRYDWLSDPKDLRVEGETVTVTGTRDGEEHTYTLVVTAGEDDSEGRPTFTVTLSET